MAKGLECNNFKCKRFHKIIRKTVFVVVIFINGSAPVKKKKENNQLKWHNRDLGLFGARLRDAVYPCFQAPTPPPPPPMHISDTHVFTRPLNKDIKIYILQ